MDFKKIKTDLLTCINSIYFKFIILISIILWLVGGISLLNLSGNPDMPLVVNFFDGLLTLVKLPTFILINFFFTLLVSSTVVFTNFMKNQFYLIRHKTKETCLKKLIKNVFIINTIIFLFETSILILVLLIFSRDYQINAWMYDLPNYVYFLFQLFKIFCLAQLLSILSVIIMTIVDQKIVIIINVLLYGLCYTIIPNSNFTSLFQTSFFFPRYITTDKYASFPLELSSLLIYIIFLICIIYIIVNIVVKLYKRRDYV